jgi:hypothetical protein
VPDDPNVIKHDPIEDDPAYHTILEAADKVEHDEFNARNPGPAKLGNVHGIWAIKKRILKDKHGIVWRTPAELNPRMALD